MSGRAMLTIIEVLVAISLLSVTCSNGLQCMDQNGQGVDWYIIYKLPKKFRPNDIFYYMDDRNPTWRFSNPVTLKGHGQAVYHTLQQIYGASLKGKSDRSQDFVNDVLKWRSLRLNGKNKFEPSPKGGSDILYGMYNDDLPNKSKTEKSDKPERSEPGHWWHSVQTGHTKGVIGFDQKSGFWLVQSTPKFPPYKADGYSWPSNGNSYAQSFLCISMATNPNLDEIGKQFEFNYPHIYDKHIPDSFKEAYPNITAALSGAHRKTPPWNRKTLLTSMAGKKFFSYAKSAQFDADLYSVWVAPDLGNNLLVESWQSGRNKLCSNCTGKYKVYNVDTILFGDKKGFKETQDHAKWAVTNTTDTGAWTCIGDINRQQSQMKRGGGTVCTDDKDIWSAFRNIITTYHDCKPYKKCVEE